MPRPRLTNEQAALRGADRKDPQRFRDRKACPKHEGPIGNPPEGMAEDAKRCWFEFVTYAIPGTMTAADRLTLEAASNLMAEYRRDTVEFTAAKLGALLKVLSLFGMSPVDRQKLGASNAEKQANPFASLDS